MDKEWVKKLFSFVWFAVDSLPFYSDIVDLELCGSYAFGTNGLGSDIDINIALADYNHQVPAKQWWYTSGGQIAVRRRLMDFEKEYGLHIDIGVQDPNSVKYNVVASTKKFELYNRGRPALPVHTPGLIPPYPLFSDKPMSVVNILDFDPAKDIAPPIFPQHLRFDAYVYYFIGVDRNFQRTSKWAFDEWASEMPYWKERYGDQFQGYTEINGELIGDR